MTARSLLSSLLLIAMLATAAPDAVWAGKSERGPVDQPAKESDEKEKEESAGKSEIEDSDDFKSFAVVADSHGWTTRTWTLHDLENSHSCSLHRDGPNHCRAPPALLF